MLVTSAAAAAAAAAPLPTQNLLLLVVVVLLVVLMQELSSMRLSQMTLPSSSHPSPRGLGGRHPKVHHPSLPSSLPPSFPSTLPLLPLAHRGRHGSPGRLGPYFHLFV